MMAVSMPLSCVPNLSREDLMAAARLSLSLPPLLRRPIRPDEARAGLRRRLVDRENAFLELVRRAVFFNSSSPYRHLLRLAGCEQGDFERLVRQEGLEGALRRLYEQ